MEQLHRVELCWLACIDACHDGRACTNCTDCTLAQHHTASSPPAHDILANLSPRHARRRSLCSFADNVRSLFLPGSREEKISYIGASLQSFTRLKNLDLSCNSLVSLEGLHSLRALEKLNLWVVPAQLTPFLHEQSVCRHCARMARMVIPLKAHTCDTATCRRDSL